MDKYHMMIIFFIIIVIIITSLILYKVWNTRSNYVGSNTISLLQWNTHYECFIKNNDDCCSKPLITYLNTLLNGNIDFANLSMFEITNYSPPNGYSIIDQYSQQPVYKCGQDITTLVYNNINWSPVGTPIYGCLNPKPDRAFIIQQFKNKTTGFDVYVIGAHMDHPAAGQSYPIASVQALADALTNNGITQSNNIILLADTNDANPSNPTPDSTFMSGIFGGSPVSNVQGAGANSTCCCNDGTFPYKTDRIISNFGKSNGPAKIIELNDPALFGTLGNCPSASGGPCTLGEMHKPVLWSLSV